MKLVVAALALGTLVQAPSPDLERLDFLVGSWQGEAGSARFEEHWIHADGGTMLGVSRTIVSGKTVAFEFLRIEKREERIFYVAQPNGRPGTDFELTEVGPDFVLFENPEHDHPKKIRYRRSADGGLVAEIEGDEDGRAVKQSFVFRPRQP